MKKALLFLIVLSFLPSVATLAGSGDEFRFAVLGDNRSNRPIVQPEPYKQNIRAINLLAPDFVVIVGDLILGYTEDEELIIKEWEEFDRVTSEFQMPYYLVVGNHDVWNKRSEEIYRSRYGRLYYSFDYKNSHFIVLNSEDQDSVNYILGDQLEWLKKDLEAHRETVHKFVFLHKPLWEYEEERTNWNTEIHPLLAKYGVDVVFAGHWHLYKKSGVRDGVKYIITGGAGAPLSGTEEQGGFYHFIFVTVKGERVKLAVIRTEGVISEEGKIPLSWTDIKRIELKGFSTAFIDASLKPPFTKPIVIKVVNPLNRPAEGEIQWHLPGPDWEINPMTTEYSVDPDSEIELTFNLSAGEGVTLYYPLPHYEATFLASGCERPIVVSRELRLVRGITCTRTQRKIIIDGVLDDWDGITPLRLNQEHLVRFYPEFKWGGIEDLSADIFLAWDDQNFYFAAAVRDDLFCQPYEGGEIWRGDSIQFSFDTLNDDSPAPDENDYEYGFAMTDKGKEMWRWYAARGRKLGRVGKVEFSFSSQPKKNQYIYEVAIPWNELTPLKPQKGKVCGFNVIVNDNDGQGRKGWIQWTPGIGEGKDTSFFDNLTFK